MVLLEIVNFAAIYCRRHIYSAVVNFTSWLNKNKETIGCCLVNFLCMLVLR